jgi:hypothetical protein
MREWERLPLDQAIDAGIESLAEAYRTGNPNKFIAAASAQRKKT